MGGLWLLNVVVIECEEFQSMLALSHNHAQKRTLKTIIQNL